MTIDGKQYKVADVMREPVLVPRTDTLRDALALLMERNTNLGIVVDKYGTFVGTVTTLDIIRAVLPDYLESDEVAARFADDTLLVQDARNAANMPVCDFLDRKEITITAEATLLEATVIATQDSTGRIVVLDEEQRPIGVLTRTEIKRVLAAYLGIKNELG